MQTRKEHLLAHGKITAITRGRISGENLKWLQSEFENGVRFSDWTPDRTEIRDGKSVTIKSTDNSRQAKAVLEYTIHYPENEFRAVEGDNTERSMRSACNNCKVSLVQCTCGSPRIVARDGGGSVLVSILRK